MENDKSLNANKKRKESKQQKKIIQYSKYINEYKNKLKEVSKIYDLEGRRKEFLLKQHKNANRQSPFISGAKNYTRGHNSQEYFKKNNLRDGKAILLSFHEVQEEAGNRVLIENYTNPAEREWLVLEGEKRGESRAFYLAKPDTNKSVSSISTASVASQASTASSSAKTSSGYSFGRQLKRRASASSTSSQKSVSSTSSRKSVVSDTPLEEVGAGHTFIEIRAPDSQGEHNIKVFFEEEARRKFKLFTQDAANKKTV